MAQSNGHAAPTSPVSPASSGSSATSAAPAPAAPPPKLITRAEYERRLRRAMGWWWFSIFFFGGGALSIVGLAVTQREILPPASLAGMGIVVLWALQRLVYVLRRRPK